METESRSDSVQPTESVSAPPKPSRRPLIIAGIALVAVVLVVGSQVFSRSGSEPGRTKPTASTLAQVKQGDPNKVAAEGSELQRVTTPPDNAHVMVSLPAGTPELTFAVKFEPYGLAPSGGLVIRVSEASPVGENADAKSLAARMKAADLVVAAGSDVSPVALRGGKYSGTIRTVAEKDEHSFVLTNAEELP